MPAMPGVIGAEELQHTGGPEDRVPAEDAERDDENPALGPGGDHRWNGMRLVGGSSNPDSRGDASLAEAGRGP
jgi:hypothetical protein